MRTVAGFRVREKGKVGSLSYTLAWFFPRQGDRFEVRVNVRFDGDRIGAPTTQKNDSRSGFLHEQKLRLQVYPDLDLAHATGVYDTPFGIGTTTTPYVEGNHWTALADARGGGGVCIANRGTMGSVCEEDGAFSVPLAFSIQLCMGCRGCQRRA